MPVIEANEETKQTINRFKALKAQKQPWLDHWQLIGEFIHSRKQEFQNEFEQGAFLNQNLFDSTAPRAAKIAASSILSMLWPQAVKRFMLERPRQLTETQENKEYYEFVTEEMEQVLDDPKSGLPTALVEYMLDQMSFATSGIEIQPDRDTKVSYRPWGVKHMTIDEGPNGEVNTIFIEIKQAVQKIVGEYGIDKVSEVIRDAFKNNRLQEEHTILIAIEPRLVIKPGARGNDAMPFRSQHIEMDSGRLLRKKGFNETPIKVTRFTKLMNEKYGRGFGMDALPDALEVNTVWEAVTIAIEKSLDPPLGVLDDGRLGNGEIDTSAGGLSVFKVSGRIGDSNPIFPLFTVGEIRHAVNLIEKLDESINNHFSIDRLLDFNNETQMTLGEAQIRNRLRNATLSAIFVRQIAELFNPLIERTFNIMLEQGHLGVIRGSVDHQLNPDARVIPDDVAELMATGQDVYQIKYFTPATRIMQAEEAEGLLRTWDFAGQVVNAVPDVVDNLDQDESIRRFREIAGAPSQIQRPIEKVDAIRKAREEQAEAARRAQAFQQTAEGVRNIGQSGVIEQLGSAA